MQSPKNSLNYEDWVKIQNNFLIFVSPILTIYLGALSAAISEPGHILSFSDLVPNSIIMGMMLKQVIDSLIDIFRKYNSGS